MATLYDLSNRWDQSFFSTAITSPVNASLMGLTIIDVDRTLRRRAPRLKTSDLYIPFQYIEKVPVWSKAANYSEYSDIIGRFEPIQEYANSGVQEVPLDLIYHAEARYNYGANTHWTLENIEKYEKRLKSIVFPMYTKGYNSPSKVLLNIANIWVNVPVVIKNVEIDPFEPYDIVTGLSITRKIKLTTAVSYPMWQSLSMEQIYIEKTGNEVFAYKQMSTNQLAKTTSDMNREQRIAQYRSYLNK